MTVNLTREFHRIDGEVHRRIQIVGEHVIWFEFLELGEGSTYDDVYDEGAAGDGGLSYKPGVRVPTIYAEEIEDQSRAQEEGRQPTQNVRITVRVTDMEIAGVSVSGEYGPRLKDMFLYDGRYYKVYRYQVRGRMEGEEVLVAIEGVETFIDQEMVYDNAPDYVPSEPQWPNTFPAM